MGRAARANLANRVATGKTFGNEKKVSRDIKIWTADDMRERVLATPKKKQQILDIVLPESSEHLTYTIPEKQDN